MAAIIRFFAGLSCSVVADESASGWRRVRRRPGDSSAFGFGGAAGTDGGVARPLPQQGFDELFGCRRQ